MLSLISLNPSDYLAAFNYCIFKFRLTKTAIRGLPMLFQAVLQSLLMKKKVKKKPEPSQDLSPMAQSIMQKLAELDKTKGLDQDSPANSDDSSSKNG
ncbi:MAG: hypothetical protein B7Y05_09790 [Polynucleobacter sp. 24-46-87]|nr:MAG: hypothetical protein B7Y05_09790 [Polynucleobacter sp. 24-46-87]